MRLVPPTTARAAFTGGWTPLQTSPLAGSLTAGPLTGWVAMPVGKRAPSRGHLLEMRRWLGSPGSPAGPVGLATGAIIIEVRLPLSRTGAPPPPSVEHRRRGVSRGRAGRQRQP